ncbi:methenyl tetrahydrofolate cyclohydrolase [Clostridium pasteurianum DSM 525 = ATCC 6013]|uniref:Formiminotransferase-cyclodeaminase n=3 Tax=Clostridium pasteurianum TaxID=1501 RepID=A0A0H3J9J2_CLOPA|nr:methenyl tetrahydrofolate cyclohydrolase [Clostridium pasteurianum DSM 525 = ATCC 6013]AJA51778.1 methenyl tetrahydrofolate cyclohydrolase [Clostridium pasteurianum DSM 525 = ATCC 6013]KRU12214.1 Formiminotransferase-cyclodeaminase [Clostridium pasteurianum DSM 525 = ATCC 6013]
MKVVLKKMYENMTIGEFSKVLSSSSPAPGGGGAAALTAALAASLTSMVFNLTIGKKVYEDYDDSIKELIKESLAKMEEAKDEFITYIDKDGAAFLEIINAFKMPKDTEEAIQLRSKAIAKGYENAAKVPMELIEKTNKIYEMISVACEYGNKFAVSDAGCAAILAHSVIEIAVLNIGINLSGIKDEAIKNKLEEESQKLLQQSKNNKNDIVYVVNKILGI